METSTLAFFIGIQNLCLNHNKMITSMQWMMGNGFIILSISLSIWLYYAVLRKSTQKVLNRVMYGFWTVCGLFFIGFNMVSLSLPIDEREAMEEVISKKPELASQVRNEINNLKQIGKDFR
jgi:uncharacterized protein with PQ loop repeat